MARGLDDGNEIDGISDKRTVGVSAVPSERVIAGIHLFVHQLQYFLSRHIENHDFHFPRRVHANLHPQGLVVGVEKVLVQVKGRVGSGCRRHRTGRGERGGDCRGGGDRGRQGRRETIGESRAQGRDLGGGGSGGVGRG